MIHVALGNLQREWYELDAAAASITRGVRLCRMWQQSDALAIGLVALAELHVTCGELGLAQQAIVELRQTVTRMASPWGQLLADAAQVRLDLARGDLAATQRWVQASAQTPFAPERFDAMQLLAQVLIAQGNSADALPILTTLVSQCRSNGQINQLLPALVWQARAFVSQGQNAAADAALDEALAFDATGAMTNFVSDDRSRTLDGKRYERLRWSTPISAWRTIDGRKLPVDGEAIWDHPSGAFAYGRFKLLTVEYNVTSR